MSDETSQPEITWGQALSVWWAFMWRCTVWSMVMGVTLGAVGGGIAGAVGHVDKAGMIGVVLGYLGSIPVSMYAMKVVLGKQFNGFRVVLLQQDLR